MASKAMQSNTDIFIRLAKETMSKYTSEVNKDIAHGKNAVVDW